MRAYQADYPVSVMCKLFDVSVSGFYAWLGRPPCAHRAADVALGDWIEAAFRASRSTYGRPRIHADLREAGFRVSGRRIARLMRERGIYGASRRKFTTTTVRNPDARPAPDLVDRNFRAEQPDQLRVADITYVPTWAGFLYLAVVLDACSRQSSAGLWQIIYAPSLYSTRSIRRSSAVGPTASCTIQTKVHSTPRSHSETAAERPAFDPRWVLSAIVTTMPCAKASTRRSNASCSFASGSRHSAKPRSRSSSYRRLVQSASAAFSPRLRLPTRVRAPDGSSGLMSNQQPSTKPSQLHSRITSARHDLEPARPFRWSTRWPPIR